MTLTEPERIMLRRWAMELALRYYTPAATPTLVDYANIIYAWVTEDAQPIQ